MKDSANFGNVRHKYHERVSLNLDDTVSLLHHSINVESTGDVKLAEEGVKCLQVSSLLNSSIDVSHIDDL